MVMKGAVKNKKFQILGALSLAGFEEAGTQLGSPLELAVESDDAALVEQILSGDKVQVEFGCKRV